MVTFSKQHTHCGSGAWSASAAGGREWGRGSGISPRDRVWLYTGVPVQLMTLSPISAVACWAAGGGCPGNQETTWSLGDSVYLSVTRVNNKDIEATNPIPCVHDEKPTVTRRHCYTDKYWSSITLQPVTGFNIVADWCICKRQQLVYSSKILIVFGICDKTVSTSSKVLCWYKTQVCTIQSAIQSDEVCHGMQCCCPW